MAAMAAVTAPAVAATPGPEGGAGPLVDGFARVEVLVGTWACDAWEGTRVEGTKGMKAEGMDTVIPWTSRYRISISLDVYGTDVRNSGRRRAYTRSWLRARSGLCRP